MGGGRWCAGRHDRGGGGAAYADDRVAELYLVTGGDLHWSGDAFAVQVGAVGGAEVLEDQGAVVREDTGVPAGNAGVWDDQVRGAVLAAEDELAVDRVLAAGPCAFVDGE